MRAETIGKKPYGRTSFEFDGLDADLPEGEIEPAIRNPDVTAPFALLRVVTTMRCFKRRFGFVPEEGMWVELTIRPRGMRGGAIAFHAQLEPDGYNQHSRGVLDTARLLFDIDELPKPPPSLSASAAGVAAKAALLAQFCQFPQNAVGALHRVRAVLRRLRDVRQLCVRDVGQASFVSMLGADGKPLAHFDAGWPISYNGHTAPKTLPAITDNAPVILSHWDWDHLYGYYRFSALRSSRWLTPIQSMSPGARKIAERLNTASLLIGYSGPPILFRGGILVSCNGPAPLNDNGLALVQTLSSGKLALLVGDASYAALGDGWSTIPFDLLVVTHHGAEFSGAAPLANGNNGRGVVSVGRKNVYKHPRQSALDRHNRADWQLEQTAMTVAGARGDRILGS